MRLDSLEYSRGRSSSFGCRQFDVSAHLLVSSSSSCFLFWGCGWGEKRDFINKESQTRYKPSSMYPHTSFAIWWTVLKLPWMWGKRQNGTFLPTKKWGTFLELEKCKHSNYAILGVIFNEKWFGTYFSLQIENDYMNFVEGTLVEGGWEFWFISFLYFCFVLLR